MHKKGLNNFTYSLLQVVLCILGYLLQSILCFKIAVFFVLIYCILEGRKQKYIINPYNLLILTPVSLLIYFNISDVFLVDLTPDTWLLILCNVNALIFGLKYTSETKFRERILGKRESLMLYSYLALIFVSIGILPHLIYYYTGEYIPMAYIIEMFSTVGVLLALATKSKMLSLLTIAIYLYPMLLGDASKTGVLTLLMVLLIAAEKFYMNSYSYVAYAKARKWITAGCAISIPIMIYAFTFANKDRGTYDTEEYYSYYDTRVEWNYNTAYFMPYMYIITPWANLQYVIETQDTRSNGYWFTKPILGVIFGNDYRKDEYLLHTESSFNTFSFIGLHFKDFGYWGSIFASLFLGFFIKKVYSLYSQSPSPFDAASYVFTAQATLELFFSNHFFGQSYPFMIVILMYILKKILRM